MDKMKLHSSLLFVVLLLLLDNPSSLANGQRSLLNWRRDLEYRLGSYTNQRNIINSIISSSIHPAKDIINGPTRISHEGNVRFSDLIIPRGSLVLESHIAQPTVRILVNKTQSYVNTKMNELYQVTSQLDTLKQELNDPSREFIYKGLPGATGPHANYSMITGTRKFKQFTYGHLLRADRVDVRLINFTNVDHVINETYMENTKFGLRDSQSRLFFEGRKTFWKSVFVKPLKSGCCDRLRPLHTNRMMLRSAYQEVAAPVLLQTSNQHSRYPVAIHKLETNQLVNRILTVGLPSNRPDDSGLLSSPPENNIQLNRLINIRDPNQPEIAKLLVFKDVLLIDEADLAYSYPNNRLVIGIASIPGFQFDLSHDNYLVRYQPSRNASAIQKIIGSLVINGESHFVDNLEAVSVNQVQNFGRFAAESLVRVDRPAVIRGPVQVNALPSMFSSVGPTIRTPQNVLIMRVSRLLKVGLLNGMQVPRDIVLLPLRPTDLLRIQGHKQFVNRLTMENHVSVLKLVNNIQMPAEVIPLHLADTMSSFGLSNLWFLDGIETNHITVQNSQFDDITLRDVNGDAQHLIIRSMFTSLPDGTQLIRAPLRVLHLRLLGQQQNRGLLNGFRPESIIELNRQPVEIIFGRKTFLAPVEATDCIFSDINRLANWTNHLIRIDRPNTIQTIHNRLAFIQPNEMQMNPQQNVSSSVDINRLKVEFYPNSNPANYHNNLNLSPELFILQQALLKGIANRTGGRYRIVDHVKLIDSYTGSGRVNGILLDDILTLDAPFRFDDGFVMVGKVDVPGTLRAGRVQSSYPIDSMDLVQFDRYRIPTIGSRLPIRLNNLVLSTGNQASFVQTHLLNGIRFSDFANSIMSLTRPQTIVGDMLFKAPANLEGLVRVESSLNGVKHFNQFANRLRDAKYIFEDGLQCNTVVIKV